MNLKFFIGDENLISLIKHSKMLLESFKEFKVDYDVFNGIVDERILILNDEEKNKINTTEKTETEE